VAGLTTVRGTRSTLRPVPLEAAAFRPFGEVIDRDDAGLPRAINEGTAKRLDLARVDATLRGAHVGIGLVRAAPRTLPFRLQCMERHRCGSQAFVPLSASRWLVIVARRGRAPSASDLNVFVASAGQGVNYARGTWHHPLFVLDQAAEFLVVDRVVESGAEDCDVIDLSGQEIWIDAHSLVS
jgi:ureidoglycolate lyase